MQTLGTGPFTGISSSSDASDERADSASPAASIRWAVNSSRVTSRSSTILGIGDPRLDPRIDFVGGIKGLVELENRVDSGDWVVAFALFPTSVQDLISVADAEEIMPPKSTWFEPKLADGMISLILY